MLNSVNLSSERVSTSVINFRGMVITFSTHCKFARTEALISISDIILRRSKTRYFYKWMASLKLWYGHAHSPPITFAVGVKCRMTQFPTSDLNRIMAYSVAYPLAYQHNIICGKRKY